MELYILKQRWKFILFIAAIGIGFSSLYITNNLVSDLSIEERKKIELWAEAIRQLSTIDPLTDTIQNYTIISEVIQNNTTVPVILTDENDNILSYRNIRQSQIDTKDELAEMLQKMKAQREPIIVELSENVRHKVYYKDSTTLTQLTYYPFIQLSIIVLFIGVSYYTFSQSRKSEQNRVWVGMAKETAHQLGTPTSSLLAWKEIIAGSDLPADLVDEFGKDVSRLEKIVDRFSKIGSTPSLKPVNLFEVVDRSIEYISKRAPKSINFTKNFDSSEFLMVPLNGTLFEWVLENVIKNAIDAIESQGEVKFRITDNIQVVYIDITDTGKGIPRSHYKTIFNPGFTTKERGWGLGLSLSKRIIENYHKGRIFVSQSELDRGTTIRMVIPKA